MNSRVLNILRSVLGHILNRSFDGYRLFLSSRALSLAILIWLLIVYLCAHIEKVAFYDDAF